MSSDSLTTPPLPRGRVKSVVIVGAIIALAVVAAGVAVRATDARHLKSWTDEQAVPSVSVIVPIHDAKAPALILPGRIEAFTRAPIYARVNGYLKSWAVDIGTPVKAGQVLGLIETPEIDQQLLQARADLASAQANAQLAATTAHRWQAMLGSDSVSKQEVDERTGDYTSKTALVQAAQANVDRLVATKGFARIVAPFDGVVTARDTDVGALINAGGTGQELFVVSDVHQLRVYVQLPQNYAPSVRIGTTAQLTVPEYPNRTFTGRVIAKADAVNAASGTTLVQLLVDNPRTALLPGAFANVSFSLPVQPDALRVPASALVFDQRGTTLATLGADNKVQFKKVTIVRDFGDSVEIGSGLAQSDRVIDTPPDGLADGDAVEIATTAKKAQSHG
ncbi:efflux RND transporter periplasmic adaptor subunit [Pararobbsia silviterrae]|uniref:Efflux RND transporter periplasmic adaptor subunit n=1 Tax=Pararobbsia silviterrae TaxID=1792498 RepID=A0A494Y2U7_9BURK|nr:efflux RND transporter periplasmic adaptor subunit [Pararobbsia silviterrae]RKP55783.1 efflux RND transporter periplasmic adaptor subunit [Pararobbsia silviterrae]